MNNNGNAAYTKSNEITSVSLNRFRKTEYNKLLSDKNRQKDAQTLMDYLCGKFNIPKVRVIVTNTPQPHSTGLNGNLTKKTLGTYKPYSHIITIYNTTAVKKQEISIKVFTETLLHEFIHHYDY